MPEFYRLGMTKEEINKTLLTAVLEPQSVVAGNFALFTKDGQIIDSKKTAADFALAPLDRNLSLYVSASSGSDNNDGQSPYQAKKTIMSAISSIPKNLGGCRVLVNISSGIYQETVKMEGFYGPNYSNNFGIQLIGENKDSVKITGGVAGFGCRIPMYLRSLSISGNYSGNTVSSRQCTFLAIKECDVDGSSIPNGSNAAYFEISDGTISDTIISNTKGTAVAATQGVLYVNHLSGSGNDIGVKSGTEASGMPSLVIAGSISIDADIKYQKVNGGTIIENGVLI